MSEEVVPVVAEDIAKAKVPWYKSDRLKMIIMIIPFCIMAWQWLGSISDDKVKVATVSVIKNIKDSLQDVRLNEQDDKTAYCHKRIDETNDIVKGQGVSLTELSNNMETVKNVLLVLANKIDRTLIPLLQQRQVEIYKLDSLNNSNSNYQTYQYDSLTAVNEANEFYEKALIIDLENQDIFSEADYKAAYDKAYQTSYTSPFAKKDSDFKNFILFNTNLNQF